MLKLIKELFASLSTTQRRRFYRLQVLVILAAFLELLGIASIAPFMALIGDPEIISGDSIIGDLYRATGINDTTQFSFFLGIMVLFFISLSTIVSLMMMWRISMFAAQTGVEIGDNLYRYYLKNNWLFHASVSSATLTKNIATEANRITIAVMQPLMAVNARLTLALVISISLIIYNPVIAFCGIALLGTVYFILYYFFRKRLQNHGKNVSINNEDRYRLMNDGFGGVKDILVLNRSENYITQFERSGAKLAKSIGRINAYGLLPRYLIEFVVYGSIIFLVLFLVEFHNGKLEVILPILSVYALAGFKLLPAFQNAYASLTQVRGNIAAFQSIKHDLKVAREDIDQRDVNTPLDFTQAIQLENVAFRYPSKPSNTLQNINITVKKNESIGIVGPSGSGKSTMIDVLLGLIEPTRGAFLVDGQKIVKQNCKMWQKHIGYVPQSIFLGESSIAENIAFGIPRNKINHDALDKAIKLAHLQEFINGLEKGIDTFVGERGVQLSGGQQQRVGIARALYNNPQVLIFDEATSALDGISEKIIMEAINSLRDSKTIITIAHRVKTVQNCDKIYFLDMGEITAQGSYETLVNTHPKFKKMTDYS